MTGQAWQLKITLVGSKPPIWRRVQVPATLTLAQLHRVIQQVMGWEDCHLHLFQLHGEQYGVLDPALQDAFPVLDEAGYTLHSLNLGEKSRFSYEYDLGDGWMHTLVVEKILETDCAVPVCLAGKRACPPEDCGGIWGYEQLLDTLSNPADPEHAALQEWLGGPFDAEAFDLKAIHDRLAAAFAAPSRRNSRT